MARDDIGDEIGDIEDVKFFSEDYANAVTREDVQQKMQKGSIHLIPDGAAILGPHFEHMPDDYGDVLDFVIDRSQRFSVDKDGGGSICRNWGSPSPSPKSWPTSTKEWAGMGAQDGIFLCR